MKKLFIAGILLCGLDAGLAQTASFKAGFVERDISPALGMEEPGGYGKVFHKKFHDPCKVRAVVFDDGQRRVALVGLDALMVPRSLVVAARKEIQARCGITPEAIMVGASHSHSSGPLGMIQPGDYDQASALVKELAYKKSSCADAGYLERVKNELVQAVCAANEARVAARCGFGRGLEDRVAFNRRIRMKNGVTFSHPGKGNPDAIDYAGPTDPEVGVIGVWDSNGKILGCIVNFACHATTSPGGISANWIYYLEQTIRGTFGQNVNVVFLQGDCGDVTQVDNLSPAANPSGEKWAQIVGGSVGAEATKVLLRMTVTSDAPLAARSKVWTIKRRVPNPQRVKSAYEIVQGEDRPGAADWIFAKETVLLEALIAKEPAVEVEAQAVQIGPAIFISNPAELFCAYGLELKQKSPFAFTFPVELANGCVGYVPTEEAMGEHGGGYETRLTSYSNLEISAGNQFVQAGLELARSLSPGKVPQPPRAPSFQEPWSYGNLPAQKE